MKPSEEPSPEASYGEERGGEVEHRAELRCNRGTVIREVQIDGGTRDGRRSGVRWFRGQKSVQTTGGRAVCRRASRFILVSRVNSVIGTVFISKTVGLQVVNFSITKVFSFLVLTKVVRAVSVTILIAVAPTFVTIMGRVRGTLIRCRTVLAGTFTLAVVLRTVGPTA